MPIPTTDPDMQPSPPEEYGDEIDVKCQLVGDGIVGRVSRFRRNVETKFGNKVVVSFDTVTAACSAGVDLPAAQPSEVFTIWATPGLVHELDQKSVCEGDRIALALAELIDTDKGNPFKAFGVKVLARSQPAPAGSVASAAGADPFAAA